MIVYEVSLDVDAAVADEFRAWLGEHVRGILALPGFVNAEIGAIDADADAPRRSWCVHYRLHDRAALERYLNEFAPAMRADGVGRFGSRFTARRRVFELEPLQPASAAPQANWGPGPTSTC